MWTLAFWKTALEAVLSTFGAVFAATLKFTTMPTTQSLKTAAISGGMMALYVFIKQLGGAQAIAGVVKVVIKGKHVAQNVGK